LARKYFSLGGFSGFEPKYVPILEKKKYLVFATVVY
jgi:hypothetical protein